MIKGKLKRKEEGGKGKKGWKGGKGKGKWKKEKKGEARSLHVLK